MDDISSFARTLTKLERLMAKLDMAVSNTRCMFGVKNMELTYDVSLRVAELMEKANRILEEMKSKIAGLPPEAKKTNEQQLVQAIRGINIIYKEQSSASET